MERKRAEREALGEGAELLMILDQTIPEATRFAAGLFRYTSNNSFFFFFNHIGLFGLSFQVFITTDI